MKATKIVVEWTEKVTCRDTLTVRWEDVLAHLEVPPEDWEDFIITDDDVLDYAFETNLLEADIGNTKDSDILDSDVITSEVIDVAPITPPGQLTMEQT